ncbi:MAG TPA: aspartate aminotransferase family protein [Polyangium sp.]|nr:aspartate aminotransferase family protein [Polyangium sp.]
MSVAEKFVQLRTEIPGPGSRALIARREAATPPGAAKLTPIAIQSAHGVLVTDVDGNQFIDMAGGIGTLAVGHTPKAVVEALKDQAEKLIHMCAIVATYEPAVALCERLNALAPGDFPKRTVLMNSGAEALETAVHICRSYTKRQGVVVVDGAYHGRTNLTMAMTSKFNLFKKGFGPFAPEIYRFPFPNVYRRPEGMSADAWVDYHVANLEHTFMAIVDPSHVAAVVIEPVLGEGGFLPVPAPYLRKLREWCTNHGIVMVCDEVQSGMGRTGKLWSCEHAGVVPDIITTAKSLGAGMPISAVIGREEIMMAPHPGGLGGTYSGNPLACVAALAALDEITSPAFLERAIVVGERMRKYLDSIAEKHPKFVGDVRGLGPMLALELVKDPKSKAPWMEATQAVTAAALQRGIFLLRAGLYSNCVRLLPPLMISDAQIDEAMTAIAAAFDDVAVSLGVS